jgi:shikimate kinase
MSILLLGYRGSGKTSLGKELASRLWWKFLDTDQQVIATAKKSIAEIFATAGEPAFRDLESAALTHALTLPDHVISLGGGAVLREENRQAILASKTKRIYLKCTPEVLHARIHADPHSPANRPALTPAAGSLEEIQTLLSVREPLYRQVATAELDVTNLSLPEALARITRLV